MSKLAKGPSMADRMAEPHAACDGQKVLPDPVATTSPLSTTLPRLS